MTKRAEKTTAPNEAADNELDAEYSADTPDYEESHGEFPVHGFEPLYVPKGVKLADLLARIEALEAKAGVKPKA